MSSVLHVFLFNAQIEGKTELQLDSSSNQKEAAQNKEGNRIMPKRPTCYDMIMDAKPLPYIGWRDISAAV